MPTHIPENDFNTPPSVSHYSIPIDIPQTMASVPDSIDNFPGTSMPSVPATRPHRTITKPAWLQDYDLTTLPKGKKAIGFRWIYKVKLLPDGKIDRYKAQLVAKGYIQIEDVKAYLDNLFTIKDLGFARYFLGLELARSSHGTHVTQYKYLRDIFADCKMQDAHSVSIPVPPGIHFDSTTGALLPSPDRYRRLIGRLLYLGFSRPDISFAVQQLSQFLQHPREPHWDAAMHLLRYLKGSSTLGLFFPASTSLQLCAYYDSDWASCPDTRSYLLQEFGVAVTHSVPFWCDNKAAIHITEYPVFHERTKHLDINCHLVHE
ncbi:UNVERIFIED_CONTAM: Retrovirus-related Pol polyprotein from transposon RE1 [Sesamum radiatum]|uniref:Retrovirus-related Pol polyprotein from transposon RE1 n=1 Tax=Sesamum radiatum TaxID=300843 RepID=A0AAW2PI38_SESRA